MASPLTPPLRDSATPDHSGTVAHIQTGDDSTRALMALDAGRMGSWMHDVVEDHVWGDRIVADLFGFDLAAQPWSLRDFFAAVHPDDTDRVARAVDEAYAGVVPFYDIELRRKPAADSQLGAEDIWIGSRAQVTERDADGRPMRVIGVNWDVSATKRSEFRLSMLAAEMDHRVKNAFAVIQAMIGIGSEKFPEAGPFATTLRSQVEAMATAHTHSARMARQQKKTHARVAMIDLVETALGPWMHSGSTTDAKVHIDSKADILLHPKKTVALSMILYELTTNAAKHGALGRRGGTLRVAYGLDDADTVRLTWTERFARQDNNPEPFQVDQGFGAILLGHCARNLSAQTQRDLTDTGLIFEMMFPMTAATDTDA